jgi:hypothetical protein
MCLPIAAQMTRQLAFILTVNTLIHHPSLLSRNTHHFIEKPQPPHHKQCVKPSGDNMRMVPQYTSFKALTVFDKSRRNLQVEDNRKDTFN